MVNEIDIKNMEKDWAENPRWNNVKRDYSAADVVRLRGSVQIEHTWLVEEQKNSGNWLTKKIISTVWEP